MSITLAKLKEQETFPEIFTANYWQSDAWKKAKEDNGCRSFWIKKNDAKVLVIERKAHFLKFWIKPLWELPRGPIGNSKNFVELIETVFFEARKKENNVGNIRIYTPFGTQIFWSNELFTEFLKNNKNKKAPEIFPTNTLMINLELEENEILAQMKQKGRYNIKLARKKGVVIEEEKDVENFWNLMLETSKRDGFRSNKKHVYSDLLQSFGDNAVLYTAKDKTGDVLASAIFTMTEGMALYNYGASTNRKRGLMAPYLLQWAGIQWAKNKGATVYDFLGISPENTPNHSLNGVASFKLKFGGTRIICDDGLDFPM
ncbi:TPA: peptidoglycan bridge formation glycyltransferase FemA/FemB family protein [Candidatus Gracilibacteria bacterium]|nr:peptidoglycan bridge formation glycyltransferase FemA/FemB family protein [Candidatus Gracilibacteria bacterium]HIQ57272.1 peptidoglycan bridge formation glycyltransferase FemA/FemB family protein [Candidatus Gracilibacteria bacterium]